MWRETSVGKLSMPTLRYIHINSEDSVSAIDVVTQLHYLLTPGEAPNPDAPFWDLTVGGTPLSTGDESNDIYLLTTERVSQLANALQNESWEKLERIAENNHDMIPGWHRDLRPDFERIRDFMTNASHKGNAVVRVKSSGGFWYR